MLDCETKVIITCDGTCDGTTERITAVTKKTIIADLRRRGWQIGIKMHLCPECLNKGENNE